MWPNKFKLLFPSNLLNLYSPQVKSSLLLLWLSLRPCKKDWTLHHLLLNQNIKSISLYHGPRTLIYAQKCIKPYETSNIVFSLWSSPGTHLVSKLSGAGLAGKRRPLQKKPHFEVTRLFWFGCPYLRRGVCWKKYGVCMHIVFLHAFIVSISWRR